MSDYEVTIDELNEDEIIKRNKKGVAFAAWIDATPSKVLYGDNALWKLTGGDVPDKMVIPEDFHKRIKLTRYFYELDPIANTAIDKFIDIGISDLILDRNDCDDDELAIYESVREIFEDYLQKAALEYLLSGLVIPRVKWEQRTPNDLGVEMTKKFILPSKSWIIDPAYITLEHIPLTSKTYALLTIPDETRTFITKKGKTKTGVVDKTMLEELEQIYPGISKIANKKQKLLLEDAFLILRREKTFDPYPTPFLLAAIESMMFKRNLKKMDYSIASRVISAIQVIKMGNDTFPLAEDDEDQLTELEQKMLWRNKSQNIDRIFQLFSNHTLEIEWVYPDTEAMLNQSKYNEVDQDIFYALGIPRILLSGETAKSATSQAEFALFSPAGTIESYRLEILRWVEHLVDEIQKRNGLEHKVTPRFEALRLYDIAKLADSVAVLYENNALSLTSLAKSLGYEFEDEVIMKARERKLLEEHKLPEFPPRPFSPQPQVPTDGRDDNAS